MIVDLNNLLEFFKNMFWKSTINLLGWFCGHNWIYLYLEIWEDSWW